MHRTLEPTESPSNPYCVALCNSNSKLEFTSQIEWRVHFPGGRQMFQSAVWPFCTLGVSLDLSAQPLL
jgi:hypothetical protein